MEDETKVTTRIKETDIFKIKLSLSSLTNSVILCPVISSLYTQSPADEETWVFLKRGVPGIILIHDSNRDITSIQVCIADPETGFAVWRESLFQKSDYKASQRNFHTFKLFSDSDGTMAGIKFSQEEAANIFLKDVLSSIPKDDNMRSVAGSPKTKDRKRLLSRKLKKDEISSPCMFTHVTSLNSPKQKDRSRSFSNGTRKQSGSGSSLDAPDADPSVVINYASRRGLQVSKSGTR